MAITTGTVLRARQLWKEIMPELERGLDTVKDALVNAETIDQIRLLQGKAKAYRDLMRLPEGLEAKLSEEDAKQLPKQPQRGAA